jgi:hypothetical protein
MQICKKDNNIVLELGFIWVYGYMGMGFRHLPVWAVTPWQSETCTLALLVSMYHNNRHIYTQLYCIYTLTTPIIKYIRTPTCISSDTISMRNLHFSVILLVSMYHNNRHIYTQLYCIYTLTTLTTPIYSMTVTYDIPVSVVIPYLWGTCILASYY